MPGTTNDENEGWLTEASIEHGYSSVAEVPARKETMIVLYARYLGLQAKAAETAENASINLKNVGVNKSGASGNYKDLVDEAYREYRWAASRVGGGVVGRAAGGNAVRIDGR
jgi:hypothetical protein